MTQNTYGGAPQGYPQQPQQGPPPGWGQQPAQQYQQGPPPGGSPFQQAGPAGAPAQPGGGDPFSPPGVPQGGGDSPGMHQLGGRLLLIRPTSIDKNAAGYQGGRPGPLVMADLIVCDGPPIEGNLNAVSEQFTPFAGGPKRTPFYIGQLYVRGAVVPGQLEPFIGSRGQVLGRLIKGTPGKEGKPPWLLADPTEEDKILGRQIHAQWDQIQAAGQAPGPDQFGAPAGQGPSAGGGQAQYPAQPAWGQQPAQPQYPQQPAPQGPPPGWGQQPQPAYGSPPQGYPQQPPPQQPQQWPPAGGVPQGVPEPGAPAYQTQDPAQPGAWTAGQQPYPPY